MSNEECQEIKIDTESILILENLAKMVELSKFIASKIQILIVENSTKINLVDIIKLINSETISKLIEYRNVILKLAMLVQKKFDNVNYNVLLKSILQEIEK